MGIWWFVSILSSAAFQPTPLPHGCRLLDDLLGRRFFSCCRISSVPDDPCLFSASADTNPPPALSRPAYRALGPTTNPSRLDPAPLTQSTPSDALPGSAVSGCYETQIFSGASTTYRAWRSIAAQYVTSFLSFVTAWACAPLPSDLPCDTCASPASQFCLCCDHPFCSRHLYQCSDCQIAFCGNCLDLHNLEGHWSDSDTALALARTLRLNSQHLCQEINLRPSSRLAHLDTGSNPHRAFFRRRLPPRRVTLGAVFFPQRLRAIPLEAIQ